MPRRRLGVALVLPEPFRTEVRALRRALGAPSVDTQPPHITLVPPVNVPEHAVAEAVAVLRSAAATTGPLRVRLGPIHTFAPVSPVLYLSVHGADVERIHTLVPLLRLGPLHRDVEHPFVPHCTLHESADAVVIDAASQSLAHFRAVCDIDRIDLLEQHDDRVWRTLADVTLGEPVVRGRGGIEVVLRTATNPAPDAHALIEASTRQTDGEPFQQWCVEARDPAGVLMGVAVGHLDDAAGELHISEIVVDHPHRRCGVGDRLLDEAIALARTGACSFVSLHTFADGWNRSWYARRGFDVSLALPSWFRGRDMVQMVRPITKT